MTHVRTMDAEILADRRRFADQAGFPSACPHPACRRTGRCRGPRTESAVFPGEALPGCLALGFNGLYRPVTHWDAMMDTIARAAERFGYDADTDPTPRDGARVGDDLRSRSGV